MPRYASPRCVVLAGLALVLAAGPATAFDDGEVAVFDYPAWFKQTFYDLREDLDEARQAGKRGVALFFTTQGCAYCHRMLRTTFADPAFAARLRRRFDVIGLEMFADGEITDWQGRTSRIKRFAVREGARFSPTLVFYDTEGRALLRLVGYYPPDRLQMVLDYLDEADPSGIGFPAWLARQRSSGQRAAPVAKAVSGTTRFTAPPYQLDRSGIDAEHPLLVVFGAHGCPDCTRFRERVLGDPEVVGAIEALDVVHLDARDDASPVVTPGGRVTTPAAWFAQLGLAHLPALAWFDEGGNLALQTDALVLKTRFVNALGYVTERAHERGWTFQRYARTRRLEGMREGGAGTP